jgi:hypothetical protein
MIIVRLQGGLGNQMFQFAAAYALSRRLGTECRADLSAFRKNIRTYQLDCFIGAPVIARPGDLPLRSRLAAAGVPYLISTKIGAIFGDMTGFHEQYAFVFDARFSDIPDNSYVEGYFQSEKYFCGVAADVRRLFRFRSDPDPTNEKLLDEICRSLAVSVHVRRGDYVSDPHTNQFHGTCSVDYYNRAFEVMGAKVREARFFVFSDDPQWARANIKPPSETVFVGHNTARSDYEDMRLMSNCRHHIIANSSFSWWAAWLNPSRDKVVIAPKRWIADPSRPVLDILPDTWTSV